MSNHKEAESALRAVLEQEKAIKKNLEGLIRRRVVQADLLAMVLSRLEALEDDLLNVIDEL